MEDLIFFKWARSVPETCDRITDSLREKLNELEKKSSFPPREEYETKAVVMARWIIESYASGFIGAADLMFLRKGMSLESEMPAVETPSREEQLSPEMKAQMDFMISL